MTTATRTIVVEQMCDHKHDFTVNCNSFAFHNKSPLHFTIRVITCRQFVASPGTGAGGDMSMHP